MIYTPENAKGQILVDCTGTVIDGVKSFNDETFEVELYIMGKKTSNFSRKVIVQPGSGPNTWEPISAKVIIPGAQMVYPKVVGG